MDSSKEIRDREITLAAEGGRDYAVSEMIRLTEGDRARLEQARDVLVRRIRTRSDDYEATSRLTVINAALAAVGWPAEITWESRRRRLRTKIYRA